MTHQKTVLLTRSRTFHHTRATLVSLTKNCSHHDDHNNEDYETAEDEGDENGGDTEDDEEDELPSRHTTRNLRNVPRVQYSYSAVPTSISTSDEPSLSAALRSPERKE